MFLGTPLKNNIGFLLILYLLLTQTLYCLFKQCTWEYLLVFYLLFYLKWSKLYKMPVEWLLAFALQFVSLWHVTFVLLPFLCISVPWSTGAVSSSQCDHNGRVGWEDDLTKRIWKQRCNAWKDSRMCNASRLLSSSYQEIHTGW